MNNISVIDALPCAIRPFLNNAICKENGNNEDEWRLVIEPRNCDKRKKEWMVRYVRKEFLKEENAFTWEVFHSEYGSTLDIAGLRMFIWCTEQGYINDKELSFSIKDKEPNEN